MLVVWLDPLLLRLHSVCSPVFHCHSCPLALFACPIGVLANFSAIHWVPFLALGTLFVVGGLFGSLVCGWACPFGLLQDLAARIPTPTYRLPTWTGYGRYIVLGGLVLAVPYFFGEGHPLFFCSVCPAGAVDAALPNAVKSAINSQPIAWPGPVKSAILVVFVVGAVFLWRPWCTMFCPLGAIFGLFNRWSVLFLQFHPSRCNNCGRCRKLCHYGGNNDGLANDSQCIRCLDCTQCSAVTVEHAFSVPPKSSPPRAPDGRSSRDDEQHQSGL